MEAEYMINASIQIKNRGRILGPYLCFFFEISRFFFAKKAKEKVDRQNDRTADRKEGVKRAGSEDIVLKQKKMVAE